VKETEVVKMKTVRGNCLFGAHLLHMFCPCCRIHLLPIWVPFASRADSYEPNDAISEASGEVSSHDSEATAFSGRPGQVPLVTKTDTPVRVPAPQTEHDSWEDLYVYLEQYANKTHQAIRRSHTVSVDVRNKELSQTEAVKNGLFAR
jgi:hypothetical protein